MPARSSASLPALDRERPEETATALLALGCFWSPDALFGARPGVVATASGYAGGTTDAPTYRNLGDHTETVEVTFDPARCTYEDLLALFWKAHDPTRKPWKHQYRSALFVLDETQHQAARAAKEARNDAIDSQIRTAIEPADQFFLAEDYHQNHALRQHSAFEAVYETLYPETIGFAHSPAASRVNGYVGGHGSPGQLDREIGRLGLSEELQTKLRRLHEKGNRRTLWKDVFG